MGKGNRNRQQNLQKTAEERYNHPEKYQKKGSKNTKGKTGMPAWANVLAIVLVAVILLGSVSLILIYENGVIFRAQKAMKSDHYEISGTMMQYYYYYQYQQSYSTYYNMAVSYLGSADYISYFGWDLNANYAHDDELNNPCDLGEAMKDEDGKDLKDPDGNVIYDSKAIQLRGGTVYTWWDYFMDLAIEQAENVLIFCEAAYAAGYTSLESLNPDAKDEIEEVIDDLKKNASEAGYTTGGYLTQLYGNGVSVGDVRKALELSYIASEYTLLVEEKFSDAITSDEINNRYDEDKYDYHYADALTISISLAYDDILEEYVNALGEDYKTEDYNKAVEKADLEYTTRLAHFREIAPKFAEAMGNEELYRDLAAEIYSYQYYFDAYDEKTDSELVIADVVADAIEFLDTMTDETEIDEKDPIEQRIASFVYEEMDMLLFEDMTYSDSELNNWAFKTVDQKKGNVLVTITELDGTETVYAYPELEYVDVEEDEEEEEEEEEEESEDTSDDTADEDTDEDASDDKADEDEKATSEYAGEEYEFGAYYMISPGARDEYKSLELGFIVIPVEDHDHEEGEEVDHEHVDAEALAEEYLAELLAKGELTPEIFEAFAEEKEAENYNVVDEYLKGDFGYDEMDDWAFADTSRVGTGDVIAIYGENDSPIYYAVAYCFGEGEEAWYTEVKSDILSDKYDAWDEEMTETYSEKITISEGVLGKIGN